MGSPFFYKTRADMVADYKAQFPGQLDGYDDATLYDAISKKYPHLQQTVEENYAGLDVENWAGPLPTKPLDQVEGSDKYLNLVLKNRQGARGFFEGLTDVSAGDIPFAGDFVDAAYLTKQTLIASDIKDNRPVSDEDLVSFNSFLQHSKRQSEAGVLGTSGDVVRNSARFMLEMAGTLFSVGALLPDVIAEKGAITAARLAANAAAKTAARKLATAGAGDAARVVASKSLAGASSLLTDAVAKAELLGTTAFADEAAKTAARQAAAQSLERVAASAGEIAASKLGTDEATTIAAKAIQHSAEAVLKSAVNKPALEGVKSALGFVGSRAARADAMREALTTSFQSNVMSSLAVRAGEGVLGQALERTAPYIGGMLAKSITYGLPSLFANPTSLLANRGEAERKLGAILSGDDRQAQDAALMGFLDAAIESGSEGTGEAMGDMLRGLIASTGNKGALLSRAMYGGAFRLLSGTKYGAFKRLEDLEHALTSIGSNGIVGEMMEERVGGFMKGLLGVQGEGGLVSAFKQAGWDNLKQFEVELVSFAVPGAILGGANLASGLKSAWKNVKEQTPEQRRIAAQQALERAGAPVDLLKDRPVSGNVAALPADATSKSYLTQPQAEELSRALVEETAKAVGKPASERAAINTEVDARVKALVGATSQADFSSRLSSLMQDIIPLATATETGDNATSPALQELVGKLNSLRNSALEVSSNMPDAAADYLQIPRDPVSGKLDLPQYFRRRFSGEGFTGETAPSVAARNQVAEEANRVMLQNEGAPSPAVQDLAATVAQVSAPAAAAPAAPAQSSIPPANVPAATPAVTATSAATKAAEAANAAGKRSAETQVSRAGEAGQNVAGNAGAVGEGNAPGAVAGAVAPVAGLPGEAAAGASRALEPAQAGQAGATGAPAQAGQAGAGVPAPVAAPTPARPPAKTQPGAVKPLPAKDHPAVAQLIGLLDKMYENVPPPEKEIPEPAGSDTPVRDALAAKQAEALQAYEQHNGVQLPEALVRPFVEQRLAKTVWGQQKLREWKAQDEVRARAATAQPVQSAARAPGAPIPRRAVASAHDINSLGDMLDNILQSAEGMTAKQLAAERKGNAELAAQRNIFAWFDATARKLTLTAEKMDGKVTVEHTMSLLHELLHAVSPMLPRADLQILCDFLNTNHGLFREGVHKTVALTPEMLREDANLTGAWNLRVGSATTKVTVKEWFAKAYLLYLNGQLDSAHLSALTGGKLTEAMPPSTGALAGQVGERMTARGYTETEVAQVKGVLGRLGAMVRATWEAIRKWYKPMVLESADANKYSVSRPGKGAANVEERPIWQLFTNMITPYPMREREQERAGYADFKAKLDTLQAQMREALAVANHGHGYAKLNDAQRAAVNDAANKACILLELQTIHCYREYTRTPAELTAEEQFLFDKLKSDVGLVENQDMYAQIRTDLGIKLAEKTADGHRINRKMTDAEYKAVEAEARRRGVWVDPGSGGLSFGQYIGLVNYFHEKNTQSAVQNEAALQFLGPDGLSSGPVRIATAENQFLAGMTNAEFYLLVALRKYMTTVSPQASTDASRVRALPEDARQSILADVQYMLRDAIAAHLRGESEAKTRAAQHWAEMGGTRGMVREVPVRTAVELGLPAPSAAELKAATESSVRPTEAEADAVQPNPLLSEVVTKKATKSKRVKNVTPAPVPVKAGAEAAAPVKKKKQKVGFDTAHFLAEAADLFIERTRLFDRRAQHDPVKLRSAMEATYQRLLTVPGLESLTLAQFKEMIAARIDGKTEAQAANVAPAVQHEHYLDEEDRAIMEAQFGVFKFDGVSGGMSEEGGPAKPEGTQSFMAAETDEEFKAFAKRMLNLQTDKVARAFAKFDTRGNEYAPEVRSTRTGPNTFTVRATFKLFSDEFQAHAFARDVLVNYLLAAAEHNITLTVATNLVPRQAKYVADMLGLRVDGDALFPTARTWEILSGQHVGGGDIALTEAQSHGLASRIIAEDEHGAAVSLMAAEPVDETQAASNLLEHYPELENTLNTIVFEGGSIGTAEQIAPAKAKALAWIEQFNSIAQAYEALRSGKFQGTAMESYFATLALAIMANQRAIRANISGVTTDSKAYTKLSAAALKSALTLVGDAGRMLRMHQDVLNMSGAVYAEMVVGELEAQTWAKANLDQLQIRAAFGLAASSGLAPEDVRAVLTGAEGDVKAARETGALSTAAAVGGRDGVAQAVADAIVGHISERLGADIDALLDSVLGPEVSTMAEDAATLAEAGTAKSLRLRLRTFLHEDLVRRVLDPHWGTLKTETKDAQISSAISKIAGDLLSEAQVAELTARSRILVEQRMLEAGMQILKNVGGVQMNLTAADVEQGQLRAKIEHAVETAGPEKVADTILREADPEKLYDLSPEAAALEASPEQEVVNDLAIRLSKALKIPRKPRQRDNEVDGLLELLTQTLGNVIPRQEKVRHLSPVQKIALAFTQDISSAAGLPGSPELSADTAGKITGIALPLFHERVLRAFHGDQARASAALQKLQSLFAYHGMELQGGHLLSTPLLRKAADERLKTLMISLRGIAANSFSVRDQLVQELADQVIDQTGLSGAAAATVAARIITDVSARIAVAQTNMLMQRLKPKPEDEATTRAWSARLLEAVWLGAFKEGTSEGVQREIDTRLAEKFGLPTLDEETKRQVRRIAGDIDDLIMGEVPENAGREGRNRALLHSMHSLMGSYKHRMKIAELQQVLGRARGYTPSELLSSLFYANVCSGLGTQETNLISTGLNYLGMLHASALHLKKATAGAGYEVSYVRMLGRAWAIVKDSFRHDFADILKTGQPRGGGYRREDKMGKKMPTLLELDPFTQVMGGSRAGKVLDKLKYVRRFMVAMDNVFARAAANTSLYKSAMLEAREAGMTWEQAQAYTALRQWDSGVASDLYAQLGDPDGKGRPTVRTTEALAGLIAQSDPSVREKVADLLTKAAMNRVMLEAAGKRRAGEGATAFEVAREVEDLLYSHLSPETRDRLDLYVGRATFNLQDNDPLYEKRYLTQLGIAVKHARENVPGLSFLVPFVDIVTAVFNTSVDYSPMGLLHAKQITRQMAELPIEKRRVTDEDIAELRLRAWTGTLVLTSVVVAAIAAYWQDPDDPPFEITGGGPSDPNKKNALRETGWSEYTVKVGKLRFSFSNTPFAVPFGIIGSAMDYYRYEKGATEEGVLSGAAFALLQGTPALLDQTFLSNATGFMEALGATNPDVREAKLQALFARTATGIVVPGFFKQLKRVFDDRLYQPQGLWGSVLRELPVPSSTINGELMPVRLNALGEEVHLGNQSILFSVMGAPFNGMNRLGRYVYLNPKDDDPVWNYIGARGLSVPAPGRQVMLGGVLMSPTEFDSYSRQRGLALKNWMRGQIVTGAWDTLPVEEVNSLISRQASALGKTVRARMLAPRVQSVNDKFRLGLLPRAPGR